MRLECRCSRIFEWLTIQFIQYALFRVFLQCGAWLPLSTLQLLGKYSGAILYWLPTRAKKVTQKNLITCFGTNKSVTEIEELTRASLNSTACTVLEMGKSWIPPMKETLKLVVDSEGEEQFFEAAKSDNGVILLAPHIGNWEKLGFYLCNNIKSKW